MRNEQITKIERQLARKSEIQRERALRREIDIQIGLGTPDGNLVPTARLALEELPGILTHDSQTTRWSDIQKPLRHTDKTFHVGLELCPIYTLGTSLATARLDTNVSDEKAVHNSRVGKKWQATKEALLELSRICDLFGTQLVLHATFADIGVMVASNSDVNGNALKNHENTYRNLLSAFCDERNIVLQFRTLSQVSPVVAERAVEKFVTAASGEVLNHVPNIHDLLQILQINPDEFADLPKHVGTLQAIFRACDGNINLFRCLIHTYINYPTTLESDIHLGVERGNSLPLLHVLLKTSDVAKIPKLDIQVS